MNLLKNKKGLILGVANDRSIAWGIAKEANAQGAELIFSYQGDIILKRLQPLASSIGCSNLIKCDVASDADIESMFGEIKAKHGKIDFILHSVAFSNKDNLRGKYLDVSRVDFALALDISCYSLTAVARHSDGILNDGGSIVAMTYLGAERVVPNYNVMGIAKAALECSIKYLASDLGANGIRVNGISSGPIKTLAASGIGDFKSVLDFNEANSPLKRNVTTQDVAGAAVFLFSDLSSGITGENIHVDSGYHTVGIPSNFANNK